MRQELFIGSVIVSPDMCGSVNLAYKEAARIACSYDRGLAYAPQLPQLELDQEFNQYLMNAEALHGFPLMKVQDGHMVYKLHIKSDDGDSHGEIKAANREDQRLFETLETQVTRFLGAAANGNLLEQDRSLGELVESFPEFDFVPVGITSILKEVNAHMQEDADNHEPLTIKLQISGPINTAIATDVYTLDEQGRPIRERLIERNQRMLTVHAGLILARSMLWTRRVWDYFQDKEIQRPIKVIFSFDEPCLEQLDEREGPTTDTVKNVYDMVWSNRDALPYEPMIHVCGSFVPLLLKYVKYLNFDAWNKAALLIGHVREIQEFMENGGILVAGIPLTDPKDIIAFLESTTLVQSEDGQNVNPFIVLQYAEDLLRASEQKLKGLLELLKREGMPADFLTTNVAVSPQCGFGGLIRYNLEGGAKYTVLIHNITSRLADKVQEPRILVQ